MTNMASMYCVKCKAKKEISDSDLTKTTVGKANRSALKGKCPDCGTTVFKFIKG